MNAIHALSQLSYAPGAQTDGVFRSEPRKLFWGAPGVNENSGKGDGYHRNRPIGSPDAG